MTRKNKKTDQNKAWNRRKIGVKAYAFSTRSLSKTFLIICEGENTEPEYFKSFPVVTAEVKVVGTGMSRVALVKEAIRLKKENENKGREVWCVFDFDYKGDNPNIVNEFNQALELASREHINIGWSNDSIELWFILHYQYLQNELSRNEYYTILEKIWNLNNSYESTGKKKDFCKSLYQNLLSCQETAITHAEKLFEYHSETYPLSQRNPYTTIFLLVKELNQYLK